MSSKYVREEIQTFIAANLPTDNIIPDLAAAYETLPDLLEKYSLDYKDSWIALQFIPSEEIPVSSASNNSKGCYREVGVIFIHVVSPAKDSALSEILDKSEEIRNAFRGQRINQIVIEGVTPPNFEAGATLQFEGGFTSAAIVVNYYRDLNL